MYIFGLLIVLFTSPCDLIPRPYANRAGVYTQNSPQQWPPNVERHAPLAVSSRFASVAYRSHITLPPPTTDYIGYSRAMNLYLIGAVLLAIVGRYLWERRRWYVLSWRMPGQLGLPLIGVVDLLDASSACTLSDIYSVCWNINECLFRGLCDICIILYSLNSVLVETHSRALFQ